MTTTGACARLAAPPRRRSEGPVPSPPPSTACAARPADAPTPTCAFRRGEGRGWLTSEARSGGGTAAGTPGGCGRAGCSSCSWLTAAGGTGPCRTPGGTRLQRGELRDRGRGGGGPARRCTRGRVRSRAGRRGAAANWCRGEQRRWAVAAPTGPAGTTCGRSSASPPLRPAGRRRGPRSRAPPRHSGPRGCTHRRRRPRRPPPCGAWPAAPAAGPRRCAGGPRRAAPGRGSAQGDDEQVTARAAGVPGGLVQRGVQLGAEAGLDDVAGGAGLRRSASSGAAHMGKSPRR